MAGDCFTDVRHSSKNYHQEPATEPRRRRKSVAAVWERCNFTFPRSCKSVPVNKQWYFIAHGSMDEQ